MFRSLYLSWHGNVMVFALCCHWCISILNAVRVMSSGIFLYKILTILGVVLANSEERQQESIQIIAIYIF